MKQHQHSLHHPQHAQPFRVFFSASADSRPCASKDTGFLQICFSSKHEVHAESGDTEQRSQGEEVTLLWFKHDLRVDDHPGLHEALALGGRIVPYFCFDAKRYTHALSRAYAKALARALSSLREALRDMGSDLLISVGEWEAELPQVVAKLHVTKVLAEDEVETEWRQGVSETTEMLPENVKFFSWNACLFDRWSTSENKAVGYLMTPTEPKAGDAKSAHKFSTPCDHFKVWKKEYTNSLLPPIEAPESLPSLPPFDEDVSTCYIGRIPGSEDMQAMVKAARNAAGFQYGALDNDQEESSSLLYMSTDSDKEYDTDTDSTETESHHMAGKGEVGLDASPANTNGQNPGTRRADRVIDGISKEDPIYRIETQYMFNASGETNGHDDEGEESAWEAELSAELAAGEGPVMEALQSYLSFVETTGSGANARWQWRLGAAIAKFDVPASPDGCFPALFSKAMSLGVVSRRRIYFEAARLLADASEWAPEPGLFQRLGWLLNSSGASSIRLERQRKAEGAVAAIEAAEFHEQMARHREGSAVHGGAIVRHWKWRSVLLTDYLEAHPKSPIKGASPIVLVHGFGAFSEHWRGNVAALAAKGYHVYAPTLPG